MREERISIIIPAHNEEKRIPDKLTEYYQYFKGKKINFELLIVLNACKDKTPEIVKKFAKGKKEIVVIEFKQGGKGFAISEGFKDSLKRKNSLIGFVDADSSTSAKDFYDLILNIKNYDGIIASRYINGAKVYPKQSISRIILSRGGNFIINSLFFLGIKDTQCGAKIFKRIVIEKIYRELKLTQWAFDVNLLFIVKKKGFKIKEFPTVWRDAPGSTLKMKEASIKALLGVIRLRVIYSPFARLLKPLKVIEKIVWKVFEK